MEYRDNQPSFNTKEKRVANFTDFKAKLNAEKDKLEKDERSFVKNSDNKQIIDDTKKEYNPVTHKLTYYTKDEVEDRLSEIDELNKK
jgi:hypothetical protein